MDDQTLAIRHEGATLWVTLEAIRRRHSTAIDFVRRLLEVHLVVDVIGSRHRAMLAWN